MAVPEQNPTAPPPSTAVRVRTETVQKAVNALLKWRKSQKNQKPQLLNHDDDFIYLVLTLKKIPQNARTNPHKIPLPNPIYAADTSPELCLIIDDRPRPNKLTSESAKKKIIDEDIPISKVIKLSKLKTDYKPFEAKRKLADSFDMFFVDRRVVHLLPKVLGKHFFKKRKIPLPVDLTQKNWKQQIESARCSALLYLKTGTCSVVRIGTAAMGRDEIVENVVGAVNGVVDVVPKKWGGVRAFHLKFSESLALPIYHTLPDVRMKIEGLSKAKKVDDGLRQEKDVDLVMGSVDSKKKTKGRIHEVRYMDDNDNDNGDYADDNEDESEEKIVVASTDLTTKKRKKGDSSEKSTEKKKLKMKSGIEKSVDGTKKLNLKAK